MNKFIIIYIRYSICFSFAMIQKIPLIHIEFITVICIYLHNRFDICQNLNCTYVYNLIDMDQCMHTINITSIDGLNSAKNIFTSYL